MATELVLDSLMMALARTVGKGESLGVLNDTALFKRLFEQNQGDNQELMRVGEACALVYPHPVSACNTPYRTTENKKAP